MQVSRDADRDLRLELLSFDDVLTQRRWCICVRRFVRTSSMLEMPSNVTPPTRAIAFAAVDHENVFTTLRAVTPKRSARTVPRHADVDADTPLPAFPRSCGVGVDDRKFYA